MHNDKEIINGLGRIIFISSNYKSGSLEEGQFDGNGYLNGFGRRIWSNSRPYEIGWFTESNLHGYGRKIFPKGHQLHTQGFEQEGLFEGINFMPRDSIPVQLRSKYLGGNESIEGKDVFNEFLLDHLS